MNREIRVLRCPGLQLIGEARQVTPHPFCGLVGSTVMLKQDEKKRGAQRPLFCCGYWASLIISWDL